MTDRRTHMLEICTNHMGEVMLVVDGLAIDSDAKARMIFSAANAIELGMNLIGAASQAEQSQSEKQSVSGESGTVLDHVAIVGPGGKHRRAK
jgi:hypothetical protein